MQNTELHPSSDLFAKLTQFRFLQHYRRLLYTTAQSNNMQFMMISLLLCFGQDELFFNIRRRSRHMNGCMSILDIMVMVDTVRHQ